MSDRENALKEWLQNILPQKEFTLRPLTGDASFRRYYRVQYDSLSQIVMDAPPEKEALEPFIHVAKTLAKAHVHTPEIINADLQQGFLLLSDFGDQLLLSALNAHTVDDYYCQAMNTLLHIQDCSINDPLLPAFDKAFMLKEMSLCPDWFFHSYLNLKLNESEAALIQDTMNWIADEVAKQPLVFIHRDYHSRNLMLINKTQGYDLGVIDFQDAMSGPFTYDLVSLLKDCYISWPRDQIIRWVGHFHTQSALAQCYDLAEFIRFFDLCGLQRHLKVLGIFCRLYLRDGKDGYLKDLSLTLKYVLECCESYPELHAFYRFLQNRVDLP